MDRLAHAQRYFDAWNAHDAERSRRRSRRAAPTPIRSSRVSTRTPRARTRWASPPPSPTSASSSSLVADRRRRGRRAVDHARHQQRAVQRPPADRSRDRAPGRRLHHLRRGRLGHRLGHGLLRQRRRAARSRPRRDRPAGDDRAVDVRRRLPRHRGPGCSAWSDQPDVPRGAQRRGGPRSPHALARDRARAAGRAGVHLVRRRDVGRRMYTISAWETPEAARAIRGNAGHREAVGTDVRAADRLAGQTGIWAPWRLNGPIVRCAQCDTMVRRPSCACGAALPAAAAF